MAEKTELHRTFEVVRTYRVQARDHHQALWAVSTGRVAARENEVLELAVDGTVVHQSWRFGDSPERTR